MKLRRSAFLATVAAFLLTPACSPYTQCVRPYTAQITWSGSVTELGEVVGAFLACDPTFNVGEAPVCAVNGLESLAASLGPDGAAIVNCLVSYFEANGSALQKSAAKAVAVKRGLHANLRCDGVTVALRSPGDGVPPTGPGAQQFQRAAKSTDEIRTHGEIRQSVSMSEGRPALLVSLNYAGVPPKGPSASLDSTKTRGARPALPGAGGNAEVTTSADAREPSWTHDGPAMSSTALPPAASGASTGRIAGGSTVHGNLGVATRTGEFFAYAGVNIGRATSACDNTCGAGRGLVVSDGCICWRGAGRDGHWMAAR